MSSIQLSRRTFHQLSAASLFGASALADDSSPAHADLKGRIGLTTGSLGRHLSEQPQAGKLVMLDLPRIMRDELDLTVLDLMTANLPSMEPDYLEKLRDRAQRAGCIVTNLKMNQKNLDMGSIDPEVRSHAVSVYKQSIDAAARLGCRWVRPLPRQPKPQSAAYVKSYRELIDYAAPKGITLLIENFGWIQDDPDAIPKTIQAVGAGLDASVDTGNWTDRARDEGLAKAFPLAVTCDFKAFTLGDDGRHERYDLQRCFQIGWDAGFRGPWCFEHTHPTLPGLMEDLVRLRDMIRSWRNAQ